MNNPFQMMQAIRNPQEFIQNMMNNSSAMQNPMIKNAIDLYKKGDVEGIRNLTENVAKQKGTSIDAIRKQMGI